MKANELSTDQLLAKIRQLPAKRLPAVAAFVDSLAKIEAREQAPAAKKPLRFPVISLGRWPDDMSLDREDMYRPVIGSSQEPDALSPGRDRA